jgi:Prenyltransferase and squalene oxidase repeat
MAGGKSLLTRGLVSVSSNQITRPPDTGKKSSMRYLSAILPISFFTVAGMQVGFSGPVADSDVRDAATKAIALLQSTGKVWFEKQTCVSCHHQALPMMALKIARERGIPVNEELARQSASKAFSYFQSLDRAVQSTHVVDPAMDTGMHLLSGAQAGLPPSLTTAVYARLIANYQHSDGSWTTLDDRPPQAHSRITATAVAARAVQLYLPERLREEKAARTARARQWLLSATPSNTEDRTFQLLGYRWVDVPPADRQRAATQLLAEQRTDGGWEQLPNLASDAYATGEALAALYQAGDIDVQEPAYQRGLRFLLNSQKADGSWLVRTRLIENQLVSPPYFETGFPYKEHQVISCMGTSRAVIALMQVIATSNRLFLSAFTGRPKLSSVLKSAT